MEGFAGLQSADVDRVREKEGARGAIVDDAGQFRAHVALGAGRDPVDTLALPPRRSTDTPEGNEEVERRREAQNDAVTAADLLDGAQPVTEPVDPVQQLAESPRLLDRATGTDPVAGRARRILAAGGEEDGPHVSLGTPDVGQLAVVRPERVVRVLGQVAGNRRHRDEALDDLRHGEQRQWKLQRILDLRVVVLVPTRFHFFLLATSIGTELGCCFRLELLPRGRRRDFLPCSVRGRHGARAVARRRGSRTERERGHQ